MEVIDNTLGLIRDAFVFENIDIQLSVRSDIMILECKNEFSQVLLNLFNNAKDALMESPIESKVLIIKAEEEKEYLIITISDNAGGIPEHIIHKVFDPYFTTKEEGKGTGIGLFMAKRIIEEKMQGKLSVTNSNAGACFTIKLEKIF